MKRVKLILEYDVGSVEDWEGCDIENRTMENWEEYFYQADILICDMKIIKAEIKESVRNV